MSSRDWSVYQDQVADVFRSLRASVEVEHATRGVRAEHQIDVYVSFERWGIRQSWIIECKFHRRPVTKAHVLTLGSILQDVGADRGVLVAERGFQPGAIAAATKSSILLTSLEELRAMSRPDVLSLVANSLEVDTLDLLSDLRSFTYSWFDASREERDLVARVDEHLAQQRQHAQRSDKWGLHTRDGELGIDEDDVARALEQRFAPLFLKAGVDLTAFMSVYSKLKRLRSAFDSVKLNRFPIQMSGIVATDLEQFIKAAQESIATARDWSAGQDPRVPGSTFDSFGTRIGGDYLLWFY